MQIIPEPDRNMNPAAVDSAVLQSTYSDVDPERALVESRDALTHAPDAHIQEVQERSRNANIEDAISFIAEARGVDQELALSAGPAELTALNLTSPEVSTQSLSEMALNAVSTQSSEITQAVIQDEKLSRTLQQAWDEQGLGGFLADFVGTMFVPDTLKDEADTVRAFLGKDAESTFEAMRHAWRSLSDEEQEELYPALERAFMEANDDNLLKTRERLDSFLADEERTFDKVMDAAFVAELLAVPVAIARRGNKLRQLTEVGAENEAAALAMAGAKSEDAAEVLGMTSEDAVDTILPLDTSAVNPNAVQGLNHAVQKSIDRVDRDLERARNISVLREEQLRPDFASAEEQRAFREVMDTSESLTKEAQDLIDELSFEYDKEILGFDILDVTDDAFTVRAEVRAADGSKYFVKETRPLTNSNLSKLDSEVITGEEKLSTWRTYLNSPSAFIARIERGAVNEAEQLDNQSARVIEAFVNPIQALLKTGKKRDRVATLRVLQEGDQSGKVFSDEEVYALVGSTADPATVLKQYRTGRKIADTAFVISNAAAHRKLTQQGFKATSIKVQNLNKETGEVIEALQDSFVKPVNAKAGDQLYVPASDEIVTYGTPRYDDLVDRGYIPHRSHNTIRAKDEPFDNVLLAPGSVRQLPDTVLNREPGYWPRVYDQSTRFVRVRKSTSINGRAVSGDNGFVNVGFAKSTGSARAWVKSAQGRAVLKAQGLTEKQIDSLDPNVIRITKDQGVAEEGAEVSANAFGGLAFSSRSSRRLHDIDGAGEVDPVLSLERAIRKVADSSAMSAWMDKKRAKWVKTFRPYFDDPNSDFITAKLNEQKAPVGSTQRNAAESYRNWLNDVARVPSSGQKEFAALVDRFADSVAGSPLLSKMYPKGASRYVYKFLTEHPADRIRSASFHMMLGMFNPAQLFVQASQAAVAFSINPRGFKQVMHKGMALRHSMHIIRRGAEPEELAKIARAWGVDPKDFEVMARTFDKAGILQGIKANADLNGALQGVSVSSGAMRGVFEKGLLPFYEGELFSRGYAFISAGEEFVRKNKKTWSSLTESELKDIVAQGRRDTFQLHRVNRAAWQRGFIGVPTQFWQIWMKALENMLPGRIGTGSSKLQKFSTQERTRVVVGQLMLYGAGGVPLVTAMIDKGLGGLAAGTFEDGHAPLVIQAGMQQGALGVVQQMVFGEQVTTSKRMGVFSGLEDQYKFFISQEETLLAKVGGPIGSVLDRIGAAGSLIMPVIQTKLSAEQESEMSASDWRIVFDTVFSTASTGNNLVKARILMNTDTMYTQSGRAVGDLVGADAKAKWFLVLAQAMGFSPLQREEMYSLESWNREASENRKSIVDAIVQQHIRYLESELTGGATELEGKNLIAYTQTLLDAAPTEEERAKVLAAVQTAISRGRPMELKLKVAQQYYDDQSTESAGSVAKFTNRQLRSLPPTHRTDEPEDKE